MRELVRAGCLDRGRGLAYRWVTTVALKKQLQDGRELIGLSTLGLTLVFSTFIGLAIGIALDKLFHTRPYLTIVFLVLGIVAGFVNLFRSVKRGDKDC